VCPAPSCTAIVSNQWRFLFIAACAVQIMRSDLDIICLQEVWKTKLQRHIFNRVKRLYPHSVSLIDLTASKAEGGPRACSPTEVLNFERCLMTNCTNGTSSSLHACIANSCLHTLAPLSSNCKLCLSINIKHELRQCEMEPEGFYGRSFGLMLLSKKAIRSSRAEGFLGDVSEKRGFLQASVSLIACTCGSHNS
jgi:hypothetical protein